MLPEKIFFFFFGSIVGSFLNVCIHRLPLGESIVSPGSHCPKCKKPISWYYNIPLISYIVLSGRCRFCREKIAFRYFAVELLTAIVFLAFFIKWGFSFDLFVYLVFACGLIIATFVDIRHRIIPDEISIGGIIAGFLFSVIKGIFLTPGANRLEPIIDSFLGIIIGGGVIFLTGFLFDLVYFKLLKKPAIQGETESMGGGDVKLLAMIGAFLGWKCALITFFLSPFLGSIVGFANLLFKKDHLIPYGPFLSVTAIAALFWSDKILSFLLVR